MSNLIDGDCTDKNEIKKILENAKKEGLRVSDLAENKRRKANELINNIINSVNDFFYTNEK